MTIDEFDPTFFTLTAMDDVVIAEFTQSRLSDDENIEQLGHELFSLIDQFGCRKLVLDLEEVTYATSSALGKLITAHRKMHRSDGTLVLCHLTPGMEDILRSSRLVNYFTIADDVDAAVTLLG
ncbi:MAG: STAS domain-containing protein [Planctomycetaceae bacterium]